MPREEIGHLWEQWSAGHSGSIARTTVEADTDDAQLRCTWLTPDAEILEHPEKGYGAVCVRPIQGGTVVGVLGGFVVDETELFRMSEPRRHRAIQVTETHYLVARDLPEVGDLFNHSCEPTCGLMGSSLIVAMRDIEPGEELSFDYAMCDASDYDEFRCLCGAPTCREVVSGTDWRSPALQEKYAGWFSPYLVRRIAALPTA